jgi:hypothetical protein
MTKGAKWPRLSGNPLKEIEHKKRKIHAAGKKDAGGDEILLIFFLGQK